MCRYAMNFNLLVGKAAVYEYPEARLSCAIGPNEHDTAASFDLNVNRLTTGCRYIKSR
jgi:hypothetical protein